jgi:hypothetical protein
MCHPRPVDLSHRPQPVASPSPHRRVTFAASSCHLRRVVMSPSPCHRITFASLSHPLTTSPFVCHARFGPG